MTFSLSAPINIFSGDKGLGAALTNPTELSRSKGTLENSYPVVYKNRRWVDVETAYKILGQHEQDPAAQDALMIELIAAKFRQHPRLLDAVAARGGVAWLCTCRHFTNARTVSFQSWEGQGLESRFIRNLVAGFEMAQSVATEAGQPGLF